MVFLGLACAFDMWSSVAFHLYNTMGHNEMVQFLTWDLVGIVGVMLATFVSIGFVIFDEWTQERNILFMVMVPMILSNFVALLHPKCKPVNMHYYKVFIVAFTQIMLFAT